MLSRTEICRASTGGWAGGPRVAARNVKEVWVPRDGSFCIRFAGGDSGEVDRGLAEAP